MAQSDKLFAGSIPELYDSYLVPLIFEPYAADLARRVMTENPRRLLETAAGSGVVTRAVAPLLASDARYVVSDLNQPMLDRAAKRQGADARIAWRQADALALPFEDGSFDVLFCQFGAMFFPDRIAGYREARRVLKAGGRFLFSVWDRIEDNDFANIVTEAVGAMFPGDPPLFLARTPHGYHDVARIEADLRGAGFSDIRIETVAYIRAAPNARHAAIAYCQGTPLRNEIDSRDAAALERATGTAAEALARTYGDGEISGKIQAHIAIVQA